MESGRGPVRRGARWSERAIHISTLDPDGSAQVMKRVDRMDRSNGHDENWLQELIHRHPQVLPVHDLEPGFGAAVALCREMAVASGQVDNVFATGEGNLVIVECKLWRNPQARREVVAQIIDYAHSLASWSYAELEAAVRRARGRDGGGEAPSLYELVSTHTDDVLDEPDFVDAVSRNLRLGRLLLLVLGDGIHESAETLADYLQEHAGFHFTFGLVEVQVHACPGGGFVVQPRVLTRTVNIERGIVRMEEGRAVVAPLPPEASKGRAGTISEAQLYEALAQADPTVPGRLQAFADRLSDIGISLEPATKSLVLRWFGSTGTKYNLASITPGGDVLTHYVNWQPDRLGRIDIGQAYLARLAELIGGQVRETPDPTNWNVRTARDKYPKVADLLDREDGWAAAIEDFVAGARGAEVDQATGS